MDHWEADFPKQMGRAVLSARNGFKYLDDWFSYARSLPTLEEELNHLEEPEDMRKAIYVTHMPPANYGLDQCFDNTCVGSQSIYKFIENNRPLLTLHGHIHESPVKSGAWFKKFGKTLCVQPGQTEKLTWVLIHIPSLRAKRQVDFY